MRVLIITEEYLKKNSVINENADMKVITPTIFLVQDKYIHPILGTDLFNEITSQINSNTVSVLNQTLLDNYILPCMIWYCLHECTPVFKYRYMNKGVMVKNSDNSTAADLDEIQFMMERWRINADEYAERATNYLWEHQNDYPLYNGNLTRDKIKPNTTNYENGLYLEKPIRTRQRGLNDPYGNGDGYLNIRTSDIKNS